VEAVGRFLMLEYQKSSPAHCLHLQTAASSFSDETVEPLGYGGQRFLVLQHEAAAAPKWLNPIRREPFTSEKT
jgi:hypothetical protein